MKIKIILVIIITLFASVSFFSQKPDYEKQRALFSTQIQESFKSKDFNSALETAKKLLKLEKRTKKPRKIGLANAYFNVGIIHLRISQKYRRQQSIKGTTFAKSTQLYKKVRREQSEASSALRKCLKVHRLIAKDSLALADAQTELAWLLETGLGPYRSKDPNERYEEGKTLLKGAIQIYERKTGFRSDATLSLRLNLAEVHRKHAEFEEAIPIFKVLIDAMKFKFGETSSRLLPIYRSMLSIAVTSDDNDSINLYLNKIKSHFQKNEKPPEPNAVLNKRVRSGKNRSSSGRISGLQLETILRNDAGGFGTPTIIIGPRRRVFVRVMVLVDESGNIVEATAQTNKEGLRSKIEKEVRKWAVKPFNLNGEHRKLRGVILYRNSLVSCYKSNRFRWLANGSCKICSSHWLSS